ncbi:MAG: hypothetical protein ACK5Z2_14865 [Bacteroidota bacterium]|jgi:hypothetical protein
MKFKLLLTMFALFAVLAVKAQDTLHRTNGETIIVYVTEVSAAEIKYKKSAAGSGPVYIIKSSEVNKIVYSDGRTDVFVREKTASQNSRPTRTSSNTTSNNNNSKSSLIVGNGLRRKHMIGLNATDLLPGLISLSYEGNIFKDNVSLRVPISLGLSALTGAGPDYNGYPDFYYYSRNKLFSTGLDLRYYPTGQNFSSYFVGLTWEYGQVEYLNGGFGPFPLPPPTTDIQRTWFNSIGIVNGVLIQPSEFLNVSMFVSLGTQVTGLDNISGYRAMLRGGILLGWRFGSASEKTGKSGAIRLSE